MKKSAIFMILILTAFAAVSQAMGNSQNQDNSTSNVNLDQAKKDYAVFLQKLNEMGRQYGQVTDQTKQVIKEQGVPVWDDKTGQFKISHDVNFTGDGPFTQTDREIKYTFEKPGLKKGSIRVMIEDERFLHIQALKRSQEDGQPDEVIDEKYELPSPTSDNGPKAKYQDGILTVTIKKSQIPTKTVLVPVQ